MNKSGIDTIDCNTKIGKKGMPAITSVAEYENFLDSLEESDYLLTVGDFNQKMNGVLRIEVAEPVDIFGEPGFESDEETIEVVGEEETSEEVASADSISEN